LELLYGVCDFNGLLVVLHEQVGVFISVSVEKLVLLVVGDVLVIRLEVFNAVDVNIAAVSAHYTDATSAGLYL